MCADITTTVPQWKIYLRPKDFHDGVLQATRTFWQTLNLAQFGLTCTCRERSILSAPVKRPQRELEGRNVETEVRGFHATFGAFTRIDTHDVGGYGLRNSRDRILKPGLKSCRTAKALEENNVMTVEPGCYFVDALIDDVNMSENVKVQNFDTIVKKFRGGGVRIWITSRHQTGCKSWTNVPRNRGH